MKSELFFLLENAGWPVLLVEAAGTIRRANQEAIAVFGTMIEGEKTLLSAIWSAENNLPAAESFGKNGTQFWTKTIKVSNQRDAHQVHHLPFPHHPR